ncbi:MAG: type VI secretion system baseplate subunit TssE [Kiloniellaceae bacterium]
MTFERSLLERIGDPDEDGRRLHVDPARLAESVARHLTRMLNVRQGSVITLPDYGMPDFNDLFVRFPDGLNAIRRAIKDSVEKYEPRLRRVAVQYVLDEEDPLNLRFKITARLVIGDRAEPVAFETLIGDSGRVQVRS